MSSQSGYHEKLPGEDGFTGVQLGCENCPSAGACILAAYRRLSMQGVDALIGSRVPYVLTASQTVEGGTSSVTLHMPIDGCSKAGVCQFEGQLGEVAAELKARLGEAAGTVLLVPLSARLNG